MKDSKRDVLLISHDTLQTKYLAQGLEKKGTYSVKIDTSGRSAVIIHNQRARLMAVCDVSLRGSMGSDETIRQLSLQSPFKVILVTEPDKDAPNVPDNLAATVTCLNKPVSVNELLQTIDLVANTINKPESDKIQSNDEQKPLLSEVAFLKKTKFGREAIYMIDDYIFIKHNYQFVKVPLNDILLLEANNTYVTIVTTSRKFVLRLTLCSFLERLNSETLLRIHRSFAINVHKIESFTEHEVSIGQHKVPIGRHFRKQFIEQFQLL